MSTSKKIFALIFNLFIGILTAGIWIGVIIWQWIDFINKEKEDEIL